MKLIFPYGLMSQDFTSWCGFLISATPQMGLMSHESCLMSLLLHELGQGSWSMLLFTSWSELYFPIQFNDRNFRIIMMWLLKLSFSKHLSFWKNQYDKTLLTSSRLLATTRYNNNKRTVCRELQCKRYMLAPARLLSASKHQLRIIANSPKASFIANYFSSTQYTLENQVTSHFPFE